MTIVYLKFADNPTCRRPDISKVPPAACHCSKIAHAKVVQEVVDPSATIVLRNHRVAGKHCRRSHTQATRHQQGKLYMVISELYLPAAGALTGSTGWEPKVSLWGGLACVIEDSADRLHEAGTQTLIPCVASAGAEAPGLGGKGAIARWAGAHDRELCRAPACACAPALCPRVQPET